MNHEILRCVVCGEDITRKMKLYPYGYKGGAYCYACNEKDSVRRAELLTRKAIRKMYKNGSKPSEIAQRYNCTAEYVYEVLGGELEE